MAPLPPSRPPPGSATGSSTKEFTDFHCIYSGYPVYLIMFPGGEWRRRGVDIAILATRIPQHTCYNKTAVADPGEGPRGPCPPPGL